MNNPNRGVSPELIQRYREESYERIRIEFLRSVEALMKEHDMSWIELGALLERDYGWGCTRESTARQQIGAGPLSLRRMNDVASVFSMELHVLFKPRAPWTLT